MNTGTLDQLPKTAELYYQKSTTSEVYAYEYLGIDYFGNRVYQRYFNGEPDGMPRALLSFRAFAKKVRDWAKRYPRTPMGFQRWTHAYNRDGLAVEQGVSF